MKVFAPLAAVLAAHQIEARIVSQYFDDKCSGTTGMYQISADDETCVVRDCVQVSNPLGKAYEKVTCPNPEVAFDAFVENVMGDAPYFRNVKYLNDDCTGGETSYTANPIPGACMFGTRVILRSDGTLLFAGYPEGDCTRDPTSAGKLPLDECDNGNMVKLENGVKKTDPFYVATAFHASDACSKATHAYFVQSLATDEQKTDAQLGSTCAVTADAANVFTKKTHVTTLDAGLKAHFGDIPFMKVKSYFDDNCEIENMVTVFRADGTCIPLEDGATSVKAMLTDASYTFYDFSNANCSDTASNNYTVAQADWAECTDKRTFEYNAATPAPVPTPEATPEATTSKTPAATNGSTTQTPTPSPSGTAIAAVAAIAAVLPVVVAFFQ